MSDTSTPNLPPLPPVPQGGAPANQGGAWQQPTGGNRQARTNGGLGGQRQPPAAPPVAAPVAQPRQNFQLGARVGQQRPQVVDWKLKSMQKLGLKSKKDAQDRIVASVVATKGQLFTGPVDPTVARLATGAPANASFTALSQSLTALNGAQQKTPQLRQQAETDARAFLDNPRRVRIMEQNTDKGRELVAKQVLNDLHRMEICERIEAFGAPPWDSAVAMQVASLQATLDFESLPIGAQTASMNDAKSNNPTLWIKGADAAGGKQKTFIFKPQQSDVGDAQETIREAVSARAADLLNGALGFKLPMPETNIVTIDAERMPAEAQQVIADKAMQKTGPLTGSLQTFSAAQGDLKSLTRERAAKIEPKSVHEIAVLDIITMNVDRHGGNLLTAGDPPTLIPIDHGMSFTAQVSGLQKMGGSHNALLKLPASHLPFDNETLDSIAKLDSDRIIAALKTEAKLIEQTHPSTAGTLDADVMDLSKAAMEFLKLAAPTLTSAEIQVALGRYNSTLLKPGNTRAEFEAVAAVAINETKADREGIAEYFQLPPEQRGMVVAKLEQNGWKEEALVFAGSFDGAFNGDLTAMMAIYHADLRKPAAPPAPAANTPPPPNAPAVLAQITQLFPTTKVDTPENQAKAFAAWNEFQTMGGDKDALVAAGLRSGKVGATWEAQKSNLTMFVPTVRSFAAILLAKAQVPPVSTQKKIALRLDYLDSLLPLVPQPVDPDLALTASDMRGLMAQAALSRTPTPEARLNGYLKRVEGAIDSALEMSAERLKRMIAALQAGPNKATDLEVVQYTEGAETGKVKDLYDTLVQIDPGLANVM